MATVKFKLNATVYSPALAKYEEIVLQAADRFDLSTKNRLAFFLAICCHESRGFTTFTENLNYSGEALWRMFRRHFSSAAEAMTYHRKPEAIANRLYSNRGGNGSEKSGDGWLFRGRGPIQTTFHDNYDQAATVLGMPAILKTPDIVADPKLGILVSGVFWMKNGLNKYADANNFIAANGAVNLGNPRASRSSILGIEDRELWLKKVLTNLR